MILGLSNGANAISESLILSLLICHILRILRHLVLDPYRSSRDPRKLKSQDLDDEDHDAAPPPRYLFQSYLYQYHLLHFSNRLLDVVRCLVNLYPFHEVLNDCFRLTK